MANNYDTPYNTFKRSERSLFMKKPEDDKPCYILSAQAFPKKPKTKFSEFLKKKRNTAAEQERVEKISPNNLADRIGIGHEMFRKIIYQQKPTKKRDCIIAICFALHMNSNDTSEALRLYRNMPGLDESNERDYLIITALDGNLLSPLPIDKINKLLESNNFDSLDIIDKRGSKNGSSLVRGQKRLPYIILDKRVEIRSEELYCNMYDSLATAYSSDRYYCYATMWLDDVHTQRRLRLVFDTNNSCFIEINTETNNSIKKYKSPNEAGIFKTYFEDLQNMAGKELQRMKNILNDSRNYNQRIGADIINDTIHIFLEEYNYDVPEFSEYYLFELLNGHFQLSVFKSSIFMSKYLGTTNYQKEYKETIPEPCETYHSIESLSADINSKKMPFDKEHILRLRLHAFKKMQAVIEKCLAELKGRKTFIYNIDAIFEPYDSDYYICKFYHLENEFKLTQTDKAGGVWSALTNKAEVDCPSSGKVILTLKTLYRAYELGLKTTDDICRILKANGSLESVFF